MDANDSVPVIATVWTDPDRDELVAAIRQAGSRSGSMRANVLVMTRGSLAARIFIRFPFLSPPYMYFHAKYWSRIPWPARRVLRGVGRRQAVVCDEQGQISMFGGDLIFGVPQMEVIPASELPDGDDSDGDQG